MVKQKSTACASKKNKAFHRKVFGATFQGSTNLFEKCGEIDNNWSNCFSYQTWHLNTVNNQVWIKLNFGINLTPVVVILRNEVEWRRRRCVAYLLGSKRPSCYAHLVKRILFSTRKRELQTTTTHVRKNWGRNGASWLTQNMCQVQYQKFLGARILLLLLGLEIQNRSSHFKKLYRSVCYL